MNLISDFEEQVFRDWSDSLTEKISDSLEQSLIVRCQTEGTLKVNFGGELTSLLREVRKYPPLHSKTISFTLQLAAALSYQILKKIKSDLDRCSQYYI